MDDRAKIYQRLEKLRRQALDSPDSTIQRDLDSFLKSSYKWSFFGERWSKMFVCKNVEGALEFARIVKEAMHDTLRVSGSSIPWYGGKIFVEFWAGYDAKQASDMIDSMYEEHMRTGFQPYGVRSAVEDIENGQ